MTTRKIKILLTIFVLILTLFGWLKVVQSSGENIISRTGIHWHPKLFIYINNNPIEIPENIGIGYIHQPIHTHDDLPDIHLEFSGLVTKEDIMLGQFFKNWNKDMRSFGKNIRMIVNGEENYQYEKYIMQDNDRIELYYQ